MPHRWASFLSSSFPLYKCGQLDGVFGSAFTGVLAVYLIGCGGNQRGWSDMTYVQSYAACVSGGAQLK